MGPGIWVSTSPESLCTVTVEDLGRNNEFPVIHIRAPARLGRDCFFCVIPGTRCAGRRPAALGTGQSCACLLASLPCPARCSAWQGTTFLSPSTAKPLPDGSDKGRHWQGIRGSGQQGESQGCPPLQVPPHSPGLVPQHGLPSAVRLFSPPGSCLWVLVPK